MTRKGHSRRHKKGGSGEPYSSAASYGEYVNSGENSQYNRVFSETGQYASVPGNTIIGAQGQNSNWPGLPNAQNLALIQKAGRRGSRRRKGGIWGSVINQAVVPFTLLGMQQSYKRKRTGGKRTRKQRRHKK
jgi:hypothetical protein